MGSSFCPRCRTPRVGAFRFCRSCMFDFDDLAPEAGDAAASPTPQPAPVTAPQSYSEKYASTPWATTPAPPPVAAGRRSPPSLRGDLVILAFVVATFPVALLPATCHIWPGGAFGMLGPLVWLGLLAVGLLGGVLVRGWSGAAILAAGVGAGVLVFAAAARPVPGYADLDPETCGVGIDPAAVLLLVGPGFLAVALIGYGIARSVARSVGEDGRIPRITPGRLLVVVGALAWLLAQFLPAWTYSVGDTTTEAGIMFTVLPLAYVLAGPGHWVAWPANLLLAGAWWLVMKRADFGLAALVSLFATACAVAGVVLQLDQGAHRLVVEIGTFVWCASFAMLALGLAVRGLEIRRREHARAGQRPEALAPPA